MATKKVTSLEVAKLAGVSQSAVSRVSRLAPLLQKSK
jgi:Bacterial regulatory proteins, lacI family.